MLLCSVLTPYYEEDVMYSLDDLSKENEDGISILFYLQKIYPGSLLTPSSGYLLPRTFLRFCFWLTVWICVDEWQNFLERIQLIENTLRRTVDQKKSEKHEETVMDLRLWASYRGQTLARTGIHQIFNMILKYAWNCSLHFYFSFSFLVDSLGVLLFFQFVEWCTTKQPSYCKDNKKGPPIQVCLKHII